MFREQNWGANLSGVGGLRIDEDALGVRSEAFGGVKWALARGARGAVSVQASGTWRQETFGACGQSGYEVRAMGAMAVGANGRGFVNLEAAQRGFAGGCPHARLDTTLGWRVRPEWLTQAQIFYDGGIHKSDALKGQISVVRFLRAGGLQLGVRSRLDGGAVEPALIVGWWGKQGP